MDEEAGMKKGLNPYADVARRLAKKKRSPQETRKLAHSDDLLEGIDTSFINLGGADPTEEFVRGPSTMTPDEIAAQQANQAAIQAMSMDEIQSSLTGAGISPEQSAELARLFKGPIGKSADQFYEKPFNKTDPMHIGPMASESEIMAMLGPVPKGDPFGRDLGPSNSELMAQGLSDNIQDHDNFVAGTSAYHQLMDPNLNSMQIPEEFMFAGNRKRPGQLGTDASAQPAGWEIGGLRGGEGDAGMTQDAQSPLASAMKDFVGTGNVLANSLSEFVSVFSGGIEMNVSGMENMNITITGLESLDGVVKAETIQKIQEKLDEVAQKVGVSGRSGTPA